MKFLYRRIITYVIVLVVVTNLAFFLPRFAPGNAAVVLAGSTRLPVQTEHLLALRFGLDQSLSAQYFAFLKNTFLTWPPYLGISFQYYPVTVWNLFITRVGWTMLLILVSIAVGELISYAIAAYASLRRGGKFEIGSLYGAISFTSIPLFWFGMILLYIFAIVLKWFPLFGAAGFQPGTGASYFLSVAWHAFLPVVVLSLSLYGESFLIMRGSMQEVLRSDYVLAAKSRGLSNWILSTRYILRNSLLPVVSVVSFSVASMISRVVLVEVVFGYPGLGDLFVDGILNRDYPVLTGALFLTTIIVIIGGIVGDILLSRLDPRLKE